MPPKPKHKGFNMRTKSNSSANPHRSTDGVRANGGSLRDKATINRINMYKAKTIRDKKGKIVGGAYMMKNRAGDQAITAETGRVAPDRRWFGNTRVIKQEELDKFREEMTTRSTDPYNVILRRKKLPMGLLQEPDKVSRMNLLETETYADVLTNGRRRKRPKLAGDVNDLSSLLAKAEARQSTYGDGEGDSNVAKAWEERGIRRAELFDKGQSKRIWAELYKVLDCSDVVIQVLDARNVPGTRCPHLERHLKTNASHKHLIFVINKVDLVPTWVTKKWVKLLSATHPTLAFHASITNSFGKGALINLLRQFAKLHPDKKQISVGVVGYPNVGKSSIINTLKKKKVCKVAPVPGETKVWQYIALMRRIFVVDCPGVVYDDGDDETEIVLKGVVRAEKLPDPTDFVPAILERVKDEYLRRMYGVGAWEDATEFMTKLAMKSGRLLPGGEPDFHSVSVNIINDYQRGKLPYFVAPPLAEGETPKSVAAEPTVKASFDNHIKAAAAVDAAGSRGDGEEREPSSSSSTGIDVKQDKGKNKANKKKKKMTQKEEEAEEELAAIEAEETARIAAFEANDPELSDSEEEGDETSKRKSDKKKPTVMPSSSSSLTPATPSGSTKKRKASAGGEGEDGGIAVEMGAKESTDAPAAKKRSKRAGVVVEGADGGEEYEVQGDEDVAEDDESTMPSIGDGLSWDDLS